MAPNMCCEIGGQKSEAGLAAMRRGAGRAGVEARWGVAPSGWGLGAVEREAHLGSLHRALHDRLVEQTAGGRGERGVVDGAGAGAGGRGRWRRVALLGRPPRRSSLGLRRGCLLGGDRLASLAAELPAGTARPERRPCGVVLHLQRRERLTLCPRAASIAHFSRLPSHAINGPRALEVCGAGTHFSSSQMCPHYYMSTFHFLESRAAESRSRAF